MSPDVKECKSYNICLFSAVQRNYRLFTKFLTKIWSRSEVIEINTIFLFNFCWISKCAIDMFYDLLYIYLISSWFVKSTGNKVHRSFFFQIPPQNGSRWTMWISLLILWHFQEMLLFPSGSLTVRRGQGDLRGMHLVAIDVSLRTTLFLMFLSNYFNIQ